MDTEVIFLPGQLREDPKPLTAVEIAGILPHRSPFVMVDTILDYEPGKYAIGKKCLSMNEPFFQGHFPGYPVMPGVLILEALAQTGAVALLTVEEFRGKIAFFGGVKNCRFRVQALPGDTIELHCKLTKLMGAVGVGEAVAYINGKKAVNAELTFAVGS